MTRLYKSVNVHIERKWPTVSLIVVACNEEQNIASGLKSILELDYPQLQVIAVNDRSTDSTIDIMHKLSRIDNRLQVFDIKELPDGWLGKNNAMYQGALLATGDWLLFTDADVIFDAQTLKIAMDHVLKHGYDHLTIAPTIKARSFFLRGFVLMIIFNLIVCLRPQYAKKQSSRSSMGFGAFNLVNTLTYHKIGMHKAIRLCPDDDVKLGQLIKRAGFKQDFALGDTLLEIEWYTTFNDMVRGLEKNVLPPFNYRLPQFLISAILAAFFYLMSFLGLFIVDGWKFWLYSSADAIILFYFAMINRFKWSSFVYGLLFPLFVLLFLFVITLGACRISIRNGITWRGTFYSLETLRGKGGI